MQFSSMTTALAKPENLYVGRHHWMPKNCCNLLHRRLACNTVFVLWCINFPVTYVTESAEASISVCIVTTIQTDIDA